MKTLQHLEKVLRRHGARLIVQNRDETSEIVLSIPAPADLEGNLAGYAVEYRLGQHFPRPAGPQPALDLDLDFDR